MRTAAVVVFRARKFSCVQPLLTCPTRRSNPTQSPLKGIFTKGVGQKIVPQLAAFKGVMTCLECSYELNSPYENTTS